MIWVIWWLLDLYCESSTNQNKTETQTYIVRASGGGGPSPVWSSSKSCLVGARVLLQILSSRGQVIFLARLPGSPPILYEVKVDYLFILKGHFYTWVCVYMCVVRQRNRFKSVPTHPEIKLSRFVFNIFFGMCRYIFEPISLSYDHTSSSDVIGH